MSKFTNTGAGPRGINLKDGSTVFVEPNQTAEIEDGDIAEGKTAIHADFKKGEAAANAAAKANEDAAAADAQQ